MTDIRKTPLTLKQKFSAWRQEHFRCFLTNLGQFRSSLISTLLTITVIGIALALPAGLSLVLNKVGDFTEKLDSSNLISVYLKQDLKDGQISALQKKLESNPQIAQLDYINREQALADYNQASGQKEILQMLGENPLPALFQLSPAQNQSPEALQRLVVELKKLPESELVQFDSHWAKRLYSIIQLLHKFDLALSILLSIAVLLIIGNTIRVNIHSRLQEIQISRLFGASNSFIRRPFLHTGLLYGIFGGIIASILLLIGYLLLSQPLGELISLYQIDSPAGSASGNQSGLFSYSLLCVVTGACLGTASAWLVVYVQQKDLEKRDFS